MNNEYNISNPMNNNQYIETESIKEMVVITSELTKEGIMFNVVKSYGIWRITITGY